LNGKTEQLVKQTDDQMDLLKLIILLISLSGLTSCVTYHPKFLNDDTPKKPLTALDKDILIQRAAALHQSRLPPLQLDFTKPLTARELAVIAVLVNPDLKALRAKEGVAHAQVFDAGLLPDPQFNWSFDHPLHQTSPPTNPLTNAFNLGLSWDIGALVTRSTKLKIATLHCQQTHYDVAWQEWLLANQAELLAIRTYFLQQQVYLTRQATTDARLFLQATERSLQKHDVKIDEYGLRQTAYLDLQDQLQTLQRTLEKTKLQLNQVLGLYPAEKIRMNIHPMIVPHLNADELYDEASEARLDLIALQVGYASQEAEIYQAVLGQFPHFNLGISRARDPGDVNTIGSILSFDIPLFNRNRGNIAIAYATREQLYQEYNARLHQTRADIAALVADLNQIRKAEKILKRELPGVRNTERIMRQGLKKGNITQITYQDVRSSLFNKELKLLMLKQDAAEQMIALQIALGKLIE